MHLRMRRRRAPVLWLLLCCLLAGCAAPGESVESGFSPSPYGLAEGALVYREDLSALLVMGMAYDSQNASYASTLTLVVVDEPSGLVSLLSIPKDTRVLLSAYDEDGQAQPPYHGAISQAYYLGEAQGLGERNTVALVQELLGGVPLEDYAMLNLVQLRQLSNLTGGVEVTVDSSLASSYASLSPGRQLLGRNLETYASHSYLVSQDGQLLAGTDTQKIGRHQRLILAFLQALSDTLDQAEDPDALAQEIHDILRTNLDADRLADFIHSAARVAESGQVSHQILPGADGLIGQDTYFLPDSAQTKSWVLERFYKELSLPSD